MDSGLRFKIIYILFVFLFTSCNIPRDNVLDPKNQDSYRSRKMIIEAFVNTDNPFSYNYNMLTALDSLEKLYPIRVVIVEYHRDTDQYSDTYHLNENELLYQLYLDAIGSSLKGVPDVFINGISHRIQGASSIQSALFRLQQVVLEEISVNSHFTVELNYKTSEGKLTPEVTMARLGSDDASNVLLKAVLISRIGEVPLKRVVRSIVKSSLIHSIPHGEVRTYSLPELAVDQSDPSKLIVYVTDQAERIIYQCESIAVEKNL